MVKKECLFDISGEETDEAQSISPYLMLRLADMIWCAIIALLEVLYAVTRFATSLRIPSSCRISVMSGTAVTSLAVLGIS